ncbi:DUF742 domain-containing protein [Nocardia sp. alder85J]|uniref:DUF742 domain-containing protein n=1 Tax=Nocardia sp. alder85J TaxID=2862949 RepID=UPI001CD6024F|nr:DUF742 domain-containing protein [Nocardia sp. alder85J]MCX4094737.1 DUF742 domain-containing protein [Nocardia sp. alder85J]
MTHDDHFRFDENAPLLRPYALIRGRTVNLGPDLDMLTFVVTVERGPRLRHPEPEYADILELCRVPQSVAEVSAILRLPLVVTKILVSDLIGDGYLDCRTPEHTDVGPVDLPTLRAVLDGVRRL